jgi:hypothetical protein
MNTPRLAKTLFSSLAAGLVLSFSAGLVQAESPTVAPEFENFVSTKTRAEVRAETQLALRAGLVERTEADRQHPALNQPPSLLSRAQVRAEAAEAARLGLLAYGELATPMATPEQLAQIRMAGQRALVMTASR